MLRKSLYILFGIWTSCGNSWGHIWNAAGLQDLVYKVVSTVILGALRCSGNCQIIVHRCFFACISVHELSVLKAAFHCKKCLSLFFTAISWKWPISLPTEVNIKFDNHKGDPAADCRSWANMIIKLCLRLSMMIYFFLFKPCRLQKSVHRTLAVEIEKLKVNKSMEVIGWNKQASQLITFTLTWVRMRIRWRKFGDEIRWWKFSDESPWQTFSEIFDCWARMMLFLLRWSLGKDALPVDCICDCKVLVSPVLPPKGVQRRKKMH